MSKKLEKKSKSLKTQQPENLISRFFQSASHAPTKSSPKIKERAKNAKPFFNRGSPKILFWNARGWNNLSDLLLIMDTNNIICVSEKWRTMPPLTNRLPSTARLNVIHTPATKTVIKERAKGGLFIDFNSCKYEAVTLYTCDERHFLAGFDETVDAVI